jgi:hypothetical protein
MGHPAAVGNFALFGTATVHSRFSRKGSAHRIACCSSEIRQHQGVEAGKPFEQMQQAGMRTSHLDQIVRQKVQAFGENAFFGAFHGLSPCRIVSPDNASRREINDAVRAELRSMGALSKDNHAMTRSDPEVGSDECRQKLGEPLPTRRHSLLHTRQQGAWYRARELCDGDLDQSQRQPSYGRTAGRAARHLRSKTSPRHRGLS